MAFNVHELSSIHVESTDSQATAAWFYTGQPEIGIMSACESVQEALAVGAGAE